MMRRQLFSLVPAFAAALPLFAEELHVSALTPAPGDAAAFRKLVSSPAVGTPAAELERLKGALLQAKTPATEPISLLTDSLTGKRVESEQAGTLNTLAFADSVTRQLQILVWNAGSERSFAELNIPDAGRFFDSERVDMRQKRLLTDESSRVVIDRGNYAVSDSGLSFGVPLPPGAAALIELAPPGKLSDAEAESTPTPRTPARSGLAPGILSLRTGDGQLPEGVIIVTADHPLPMRYLPRRPGTGKLQIRFDARSRTEGELELTVNFMQRQKFLSVRKLKAAPGAEWQTFSETYPIPAGTTHVNCTMKGGPAEVTGIGMVN